MSSRKLTFGDRVKLLRNSIGLSQVALARETKLTPPAICQIESGKRMPSYKSLIKLSRALDISIDELVGV